MRPAVDPDYGWHVTNGQHVLDGKIFGGRDIYSWTATNVWIAHEWATEAIMGTVDRFFGPSVNSVIFALIGVAAFSVVLVRLRKLRISWATILLALPIVFAGAMRSIGVRPLMLELLYCSILLFGIDAFLAGRISRGRAALLTGALSTLWVNTHGSFVLLPVVLLITGTELFFSRDKRWMDLLSAGLFAAASALLNPWGFRIFGFATQSISSQPTLIYIDEWKRPVLSETLAIPLLLQAVLAAIGIACVLRSNESRVGTLRPIAFGYLAFSSGRHIMLFGIAAAEMIAVAMQPVGLFVSRKFRGSPKAHEDPRRKMMNLIAAAMIVGLVSKAGWDQISPRAQRQAVASHYPVGISIAANIDPSDRILNEYRWGGYLIMNGVLPVFIDGRSEVYGDTQLQRYASIIHLEKGWNETISELGITKVLMPRDSKLVNALTRAGWIPVHRDSVGVLLKRP